MFKFPIILLLAFTIQATVLQLDKHNFKQALEDHPIILVKFYIDGCSHWYSYNITFPVLK